MYQVRKNKNFLWNALPAIIIFVLVYLIVYLCLGIPAVIDDPYIFYRYAENWAAGHGLVYNIDEYVEGYSSFLTTSILAIGALLSFDLVQLTPILNLLIGIGCLLLISYICSFIPFNMPRLISIIIPLVYALSYEVYFYSVAGWMDSFLLSLILLLCIVSLYKGRNSGNYLISFPSLILLNICRAEGPVYAIVLLATVTYFVFIEQRRIPRQLLILIAIFICSTAFLFAGRYIVYGALIPATVLAKGYATYSLKKAFFEMDYGALKDFVRIIYMGFIYAGPLFYLGVWIPYIILFMNKKHKDYFLFWLFAMSIVVNAFVSIWAGGDIWPYKRLMIPVLPIIIIFTGWAWDLLIYRYKNVLKYKRLILPVVMVFVVLLWVVFFLKPLDITKKIDQNEINEKGEILSYVYLKELGTLLHNMPVQTTLLTDWGGIMPYYAGIKVYVRDFYGLMDIHNANYGTAFCTPMEGGVCGRTDYNYSFTAPFDVFIYSAKTITKRFVSFCKEHPSVCREYKFLKNEEWNSMYLYVIANIKHPVSKMLVDNYGAIPIPINEDLVRDY